MKRFAWLLTTVVACGAGDDTTTGAHGLCAEGGALDDCPDSVRTAVDACSRLVECGAIPQSSTDNNKFTWGKCVDQIESADTAAEQLIIACIAQSSCDALKVPGSPDNVDPNNISCLHFGAE